MITNLIIKITIVIILINFQTIIAFIIVINVRTANELLILSLAIEFQIIKLFLKYELSFTFTQNCKCKT